MTGQSRALGVRVLPDMQLHHDAAGPASLDDLMAAAIRRWHACRTLDPE